MSKTSLMRKSLTQFIICVAVLLVLSMPLFYWLTKNFYAEDMIDIIEAVGTGKDIPKLDIEKDILKGVMLQFGLIALVLGIAIVLMMRIISRRLWQPFDKTLAAIEAFRLEAGGIPELEECDIREFDRLNCAVGRMMDNSLHSYRLQKEFTENASHELQTPLAVFQSKLDMLMQQPEITERQAEIIQDLYQMNGRLSRLSRNLLLLAKMENGQFGETERIDVVAILDESMAFLDSLAGSLTIERCDEVPSLEVEANRTLLECLLNNLMVNAVRHTRLGGRILIRTTANSLIVANTSDGKALDGTHIFNRFYRMDQSEKGNGLGLAIVKAVCDCHGWRVSYDFAQNMHLFQVTFL